MTRRYAARRIDVDTWCPCGRTMHLKPGFNVCETCAALARLRGAVLAPAVTPDPAA